MISDDDRRDVVRRLRNLKLEDPTHGYITWGQIALTINPGGGTFSELPDLLADLIEPSERQNEPDVSVGRDRGTEVGRSPDTGGQCPKSCPKMSGVSGIDRNALIALADKMQGQQYLREDARVLRWDEAARRIREALGADDVR